MASRVQQDSFMDDTDDCCPLCVEEFDLSDKNFRPCPCGYQVCQFCYNNIKNNMNGLCPACRRPYDDKTIEWKIVSPEEFKADVAQQAKRKAAARQKEAERRQVETLNRKHLAGLRVVQKNLVYIVGLSPKTSEDKLLQTLREPRFFGQYGKIIKIVVSKAKESSARNNNSIGVYVTFERKEDAADCIAAVNGTVNEGQVLRAQYGTTKYCSAYLRNEICNNRSCMFLHETGEDENSFSRQDLSSFNAVSTQGPATSHRSQPQPPPQQSLQNVAAAATGKSEPMSRSDSGDGPALPSTANWAKNPHIQQSRTSSQAASRATPSPKISHAKQATTRIQNQSLKDTSSVSVSKAPATSLPSTAGNPSSSAVVRSTPKSEALRRLEAIVKKVIAYNTSWTLDRSLYDEETLKAINNYPPLINPSGGAIRYASERQKEQDEEERLREEESEQFQPLGEEEDTLAGGSFQLGGEPDTSDDPNNSSTSNHRNFRLPERFNGTAADAQTFDEQNDLQQFTSLGMRSLTPQQQRNIALLRNTGVQMDSAADQRSIGQSQHQSQLSNPFQSQKPQLSAFSAHTRQASRYTFPNESTAAPGSVKPTTSSQILNQRAAGAAPSQFKSAMAQHGHATFYSGIQGPPPGLKSSGTPPISGGGMFGQGYGFASAMGGSAGLAGFGNKNINDELNRDVPRGRLGFGATGESEQSKLETDPSILQARMNSGGVGQGAYGTQTQTQAQGGYSSHNMMYGGGFPGRW